MGLTYGVAALGRPTFDIPFAEEKMIAAYKALHQAGIQTVGPQQLLYDAEATEKAVAEIHAYGPIDAMIILQITFTDASMTVEIAKNSSVPVAIWAVPEPRVGGRLRLNAFCGLNLAAHALGLAGIPHGWLYADPSAHDIANDLTGLGRPHSIVQTHARPAAGGDEAAAAKALSALSGCAISVVGEHPTGFDTCKYDEAELSRLADVKINAINLETLFGKARNAIGSRVAATKAGVETTLSGLDTLDQEQLDRSFRLFCALEDIQKETNASGLAVRCWPETFTEYGCAACGPMAMMNQNRVPSACEADVYGAFSALMLQELAQEPVWMADLVDLDFEDNTGVFWHCGLAPLSMCDPEAKPEATIHTNRKIPLLHQFPLKPGIFTIARLSQSRGETKLVIGQGNFIRAPMAFTGTSGVMTFSRPAKELCDTIMAEGLEHHYAIAYGDHRSALRAIAKQLDLPLLVIA